MGAPKQKWTSEEEAALKAGIAKYGAGKWSTILKDPEFSNVLKLRSNVDLKDKWRNMNCMSNGAGSRSRSRVLTKSNQLTIEDNAGCSTVEKESEVPFQSSPSPPTEIPQQTSYKNKILSFQRLDDLILDAITKLKDPRGSSRVAILQYFEEHYSIPSDFERTLIANLKILMENEQLIKVKHLYKLGPNSHSFAAGKEPERNNVILTKAMFDAELENVEEMNLQEAAAAAARFVAEAEAAVGEAEKAAREAEEADAEAEAAWLFIAAAQKADQFQTVRYSRF